MLSSQKSYRLYQYDIDRACRSYTVDVLNVITVTFSRAVIVSPGWSTSWVQARLTGATRHFRYLRSKPCVSCENESGSPCLASWSRNTEFQTQPHFPQNLCMRKALWILHKSACVCARLVLRYLRYHMFALDEHFSRICTIHIISVFVNVIYILSDSPNKKRTLIYEVFMLYFPRVCDLWECTTLAFNLYPCSNMNH